MRDGATHRLGWLAGRMTSAMPTALSTKTSYIDLSSDSTSRYDIVLFACGSRSMSSVRLLRRAKAAARLMAVVVLPTPPFWLAIEIIIKEELPSAGFRPFRSEERRVGKECRF